MGRLDAVRIKLASFRYVVACLGLLTWFPTVHGQVNMEALLAAPFEVVVEGVFVTVETSAYLNLMPTEVVDPEQLSEPCRGLKPLIVPVALRVLEEKDLPSGLVADSVWVIGEDYFWSARLDGEGRLDGNRIARGCPGFVIAPGQQVFVIVKAGDEMDEFYLRSSQQILGAVY